MRPNTVPLSAVALALALAGCNTASTTDTSDMPLLSYPGDQGTGIDYANSSTAGTVYGGQILTNPFTLHLVFYGTWTDTQRNLFLDFARGLSGSPAMNVVQTYYDFASSNRIPSVFNVDFANVDYIDEPNSNGGKQLSDLKPIVDSAINSGALPDNPNDVYVTLLAAGVSFSNGHTSFCPVCGAHGQNTDWSPAINSAWAGNPAGCAQCQLFSSGNSPNGDPDVDSMADTIFHELVETLSNPNSPNGYHVVVTTTSGTDQGKEIADMCEGAHVHDSTTRIPPGPVQLDLDYTTASGAIANEHLGSRDYLLQPIWQNADRGGCVRRVALNRPAAQMPSASGGVTGDFDGNGTGDILWRDSATGDVEVWLMNWGGVVLQKGDLGVWGEDYQIEAIADFTGDGKADILWRDLPTGGLFVSPMNGVTASGMDMLFLTVPSNVLVKAVGDFDGNGRADILFQDMTDNSTRIYYNLSMAPASYGALPATTPADSPSDDSESVGTGDFDGDGHADVLWHNLVTDSYFTWSFTGTAVTTRNLTKSGFTRLFGIADVDGDGVADLVGTDETNVVWMKMTAGQASPAAVIQPLPEKHWRFSGGSVLGAFASTGLWWRNRQTGDLSAWYLRTNGTVWGTDKLGSPPSLYWETVAY